MNRVPSLALLVTAGLLSGVATAGDHQVVNVALNATQYNTGHVASALLSPTTGNRTGLSIVLGGVPSGTAYLYTSTRTSTQGRVSAWGQSRSMR